MKYPPPQYIDNQQITVEETVIYNHNIYQYKNFVLLTEEEKRMVWQWRNDYRIRKWMYNPNVISYENHLSFIENLKNDNTRKYWLIQRNKNNMGVTSISNISNRIGEWGYYIAPELHEKNFGVEFYYYSLKYLFEKENINKLYGYTIIENKNANSLNDLFLFKKTLVNKEINHSEIPFYYRELDSDVWNDKVKNNDRILKFLNFTINKKI
jgi:UDP-4-amino-4,6-dideoxy-N-acetyl-beta-L-altrosamine N-acetyltransferase